MNASEFLEHVAADPNRLFIRNFIDFTTPKTPITTEFLWIEKGVLRDLRKVTNMTELGRRQPGWRSGGTWSDPNFTRKHLHPVLEQHDDWLVPRKIVTVARITEGYTFVGPPLGLLVVQHLLYCASLTIPDLLRGRLIGVIREFNKSRVPMQLL